MPETFVLDCSVAAKWVLPEPDRTPALRLFERYASGEISLIAPDLLLAEFASPGVTQPPKADYCGSGARGLSTHDLMCAAPFRHAPTSVPRTTALATSPHVAVGLCICGSCHGTRLFFANSGPQALPGRWWTPSLTYSGRLVAGLHHAVIFSALVSPHDRQHV